MESRMEFPFQVPFDGGDAGVSKQATPRITEAKQTRQNTKYTQKNCQEQSIRPLDATGCVCDKQQSSFCY